MGVFVVELEDVINYLLLAAENDKLFVNCNDACVALWYKTTESQPTTIQNQTSSLYFFRRTR